MKIGIIGVGNVGGTLGTGWRRKGHDVMFGARDLADPKLQALLKKTGAHAGTVQQAAAFGDVVVLTVPFAAGEDAVRTAGELDGKILLDCTNPMSSPQAAPQNTPARGRRGRRVDLRLDFPGNTQGMNRPKWPSKAKA